MVNVLTGKNGFILNSEMPCFIQYESFHFEHVISAPVRHIGVHLDRRAIVGELEQTAQKDRHILDRHACARRNRGQHFMAQIGIRAAEIEQELNGFFHDGYVG